MTPSVLYKYVLPERIDVLLQRKIRFTQPCFLNDPFEFRPGMPTAGPDGLAPFEAKIATQREEGYREKSRLFGVLSLTSKRDSIPMWTHYAASHKGFAIGFDTGSGLFQQAISDSKLRPVQYQQDRISLTRGLEDRPWVHPDTILFTKSRDWEYEQEWRWLECCDPSDYAELVAGSTGELLFLRRIPPESIRQIVLGYRAERLLVESIQALKLSRDYGHLELLRVALNESCYKLEIESPEGESM
jgi:hypothetical protein